MSVLFCCTTKASQHDRGSCETLYLLRKVMSKQVEKTTGTGCVVMVAVAMYILGFSSLRHVRRRIVLSGVFHSKCCR